MYRYLRLQRLYIQRTLIYISVHCTPEQTAEGRTHLCASATYAKLQEGAGQRSRYTSAATTVFRVSRSWPVAMPSSTYKSWYSAFQSDPAPHLMRLCPEAHGKIPVSNVSVMDPCDGGKAAKTASRYAR